MNYPCTDKMEYSTKGKDNQHVFAAYELYYPEKKEEFLQYIIPVLEKEYGVGIDFDEKTRNIANKERVATLKKFILKNNTPNPSIEHTTEQFSVTRSKVTEIIAKDILQKINDVRFVCRTSLEEEDADMPKRGIDNFGFIFEQADDRITLKNIVICEVKASNSVKSPPDVVNYTDDSLMKSLLQISSLNTRFEKAITKSIDRLDNDEYFNLISDIVINLENRSALELIKKKLLVVPFLFRTKIQYTNKDFKNFNTEYNKFEPATIMYYIIMIDNDLNNFGDDIYQRLREG